MGDRGNNGEKEGNKENCPEGVADEGPEVAKVHEGHHHGGQCPLLPEADSVNAKDLKLLILNILFPQPIHIFVAESPHNDCLSEELFDGVEGGRLGTALQTFHRNRNHLPSEGIAQLGPADVAKMA